MHDAEKIGYPGTGPCPALPACYLTTRRNTAKRPMCEVEIPEEARQVEEEVSDKEEVNESLDEEKISKDVQTKYKNVVRKKAQGRRTLA